MKNVCAEIVSERLDSIDLDILRALQSDARLSLRQLASAVHRSPTPTFERLRRLEREGYITRYVAVLDAVKLGRALVVYCQVKLHRMNREISEEFEAHVRGIPEVSECYNVSGGFDYLLKIYAPSMPAYQQFLLNKLGSIKSIGSIESTFVMSEVKRDLSVPL